MIKKIVKSKRLRHFVRDPSAMFGTFLLLTIGLSAVFAPIIAPQNPYNLTEVHVTDSLQPPVWMTGGEKPFLLGTDAQGRGILSATLYGARTSLIVGAGVLSIAGTFGTIMGLLSGYIGGILDTVIMRLGDTFYSFSISLTSILVLGILGGGSILVVIIAISLPDWVRYARTMRGNIMSEKEEEYSTAARAVGASNLRIMFKHLLPNAIHSQFVVVAVDLGVVIMLEATLSFLGVGVPPTEPSLGALISNGREFLFAGAWWMIVFPGLGLMGIIMGINLIADWLREELNPKTTR